MLIELCLKFMGCPLNDPRRSSNFFSAHVAALSKRVTLNVDRWILFPVPSFKAWKGFESTVVPF
jgi:hypothetical protein